MTLEPVGITILKRVAVIVCIVAAYLWVSVDEWEFEQEQLEQEHKHRVEIIDSVDTIEIVPDDEVDTSQISEPEPHFGWVVPPEPLRKQVARVKKKIKKSVKKQ